MADYIQHRQCQTCFTLFPSNQKLFDHIEEYRVSRPLLNLTCFPEPTMEQSRERLLVAELELCRMHIAQSTNAISVEDSYDSCVGDEDRHDSSIQPNIFHCPFDKCDKGGPYATRGNLVRHFQTRTFLTSIFVRRARLMNVRCRCSVL